MDTILEESLKDNYPTVFEHLNEGDYDDTPTPTIALYGIQCDDGWFRLIESLAYQVHRLNERSDDEPIRAVQVKEKFGGLRFYTDTSSDALWPLVQYAGRISKQTCELCGDMGSTRVRTDLVRHKALCDEHYYDSRDIPEQIDIWKFETECFSCEEACSVVYPRPLGGPDGGSWSAVGEELSKKDYCTVERIYSDTQKMFVWGNRCTSCSTYQGNYFVTKEAEERGKLTRWQSTADFERVDTIQYV